MRLNANNFVWSSLTTTEKKHLREEGYVERDKKELWKAERICDFYREVDGQLYDVSLYQIGVDQIFDGKVLESVGDNESNVVYLVSPTVASLGYNQNNHYYTELVEAIEEFEKLEKFFSRIG